METRKPERIVVAEKPRMLIKTIYPNLLSRMSETNTSVSDLASVLQISDQAARRRLLGKANGGSYFDVYECHVLCEHFNAPFGWLFATGDGA
jgi:hypothetical protein